MATHKFATPGVFVRGASLRRDPDTLEVETDSKGRPLWDMPKSVGVHVTKQTVKRMVKRADGTTKQIKELQETQFPVYRSLDASLARYFRSQLRRFYRKQAEKEAAEILNPILEIDEDAAATSPADES